MIKDYQKILNRIHVILDALIIVLAYVLAWLVMVRGGKGGWTLPPETYFSALIIVVPVYLILNAIFGMYAPMRVQSRRREFWNIFKANTLGLLIFTLVLYLGSKNIILYHFSRKLVLCFYGFTIILELLERYAVRAVLRSLRKNGYNHKKIILVGKSRAADAYLERIHNNPEWGYEVLDVLGVEEIEKLDKILEQNILDEIVITLSLKDYDYLEDIVNKCERSGVHTKFVPDYNQILPTIPETQDLEGLPVINIRRLPLSSFPNGAIKRLVDIFGSLFGLVLFSPVMLITAIAIKVGSKGPIIFSQERVGLHNKTFKMYKFRSMVVQEEDDEKKSWTTENDPRVTRIGKIIRKTSIDEMPQFWNILKGDMSLVGPRPERPQFVEKFRDEIPHYMIKHQVRPGLTGWAQINGYRGDTSIEKRVEYDLYYIENWTLGFDIKILFLTIFKGFVNKNAY